MERNFEYDQEFILYSEGFYVRIMSLFTQMVFFIIGFGFLFSPKWEGKLVGVGVIFLIFIWYYYGIYKVVFSPNYIKKRFKNGKQYTIRYDSIANYYINQEGAFPAKVLVVKYKKNDTSKRLSKITVEADDKLVSNRMIDYIRRGMGQIP